MLLAMIKINPLLIMSSSLNAGAQWFYPSFYRFRPGKHAVRPGIKSITRRRRLRLPIFLDRRCLPRPFGSILVALAAKPGWSMEELSDWLGMERTTLVRN